MDWIKITVETTHKGIEPVCARLQAMGHDTLEIEDSEDFENFVSVTKPMWQLVDDSLTASFHNVHRVHFYIPDGPAVFETVECAKTGLDGLRDICGFDLGSLEVTQTRMSERDWMDGWRQYYKPIRIGGRILIQPEWEPVHNPDGRAVFLCEPGVSFGTGSHATTRMCLELLDKWVTPGLSVADFGCGSGILSVTALLLGAKNATASDIDPVAVGVAAKNAARNGFPPPVMRTLETDLLDDGCTLFDEFSQGCDIVCANLIAELLVRLAANLASCLKPGGRLFASGVLEEYVPEVRGALESAGLDVAEVLTSEGWAALHMRRV